MYWIFALVFFVSAISCSVQQDTHPKDWPRRWSSGWNFVNTTTRQLINFGMYYYDWTDANMGMMRVDNRVSDRNGRYIFIDLQIKQFFPETNEN